MKEQETDDKKRLAETLNRIKNRLLVFSGKGGVGKSTVAVNLALAFSEQERKVGLLDIDIHGPNLAKMLGVEKAQLESTDEGIRPVSINKNLSLISMAFLLRDANTPVIWRGPLKMKVIQQFLSDVLWGDLDWLIIDSPPGTGDEPLSVAQLVPATGAIIVTTPQEVSLLDSRKAVNFARQLGLKIHGIIENMSGLVCPHCGKEINIFKRGGGEKAARELGVPFLGTVPFDPAIVVLGDEGKPFIMHHPESYAAKEFNMIVKKVLQKTTSTS
ncbi:ATP-binding protein [candidate division WOR_3 bacterium SM23_60]|uniref:Iron-sulfur cluster carrier protein n=1 Tax=candidate division WOR_3 bacterium SM23_60 TaxID=1703780 RepID=A0A0S8GJF1_UNCW3|nr:MAG: ATP-binding protein [candidate division WOR_3 bacterium SM23_60]